MQKDSTNKKFATVANFQKTQDGNFSLPFEETDIIDLSILFGELNRGGMEDHGPLLDLYFQMTERYAEVQPSSVKEIMQLSSLFTRLLSAVGRYEKLISDNSYRFRLIAASDELNGLD